MKKMPPALIVCTMLVTHIASTPEYIILLDTVICTAAGTQGCKQFCMWLRASRWQLTCSGQYFYCQKMLSWNGEQTGTFRQWKNNIFFSCYHYCSVCFPQTFKTHTDSRWISPHLCPTDELDWRTKVLMQDLLHFCIIKSQSRFQKCFNKYC